MKKAAKIFIILGMIIGCYMIIPIIMGAIALGKLDRATSKSQIIKWGILTIIFTSQVGGILMLCLREEHFSQNKKTNDNYLTERLDKIDELSSLKDQGIITEEEFLEKKAEILSEI